MMFRSTFLSQTLNCIFLLLCAPKDTIIDIFSRSIHISIISAILPNSYIQEWKHQLNLKEEGKEDHDARKKPSFAISINQGSPRLMIH